MECFIEGGFRGQGISLFESLYDYVSDVSLERVVDVFVDSLDLVKMGFKALFQPTLAGLLIIPRSWCVIAKA